MQRGNRFENHLCGLIWACPLAASQLTVGLCGASLRFGATSAAINRGSTSHPPTAAPTIPHALRIVYRSSFIIPRSSFLVPRSSFIVYRSSVHRPKPNIK